MKNKFTILLTSIILLIINSISVSAQKVDAKMASLFMYNFINHIQWPEPMASKQDFVIGILGNSAALEEFQKMAASKKTNKGQSIKAIAIKDLSDAASCHVLYVPLSESKQIQQVKLKFSQLPLLVVSEKRGLGKKGSHINLFIDDDDDFKTKFEINKNALQQQGLKVSNQLTALAIVIK